MLAQPRCHVDLCQAVDDVAEATIPTVDHHMMFCLPGLTSTTGGIPPGCAAQHGIDGIQTRSRYSWFKSNDVSQNLGDQNLDHWTRHLGRAPSCQQESHWDRLSLHVCQVLAQFLLYGILEARAIRQAVLLSGTQPECQGKQHCEANPWEKCVHSARMRLTTSRDRLTGQECGKRTCCTNMQLEPRCSMYICMCNILADRRQLLHDMQCNAPKTLTPGLAKVIFFWNLVFDRVQNWEKCCFGFFAAFPSCLLDQPIWSAKGKRTPKHFMDPSHAEPGTAPLFNDKVRPWNGNVKLLVWKKHSHAHWIMKLGDGPSWPTPATSCYIRYKKESKACYHHSFLQESKDNQWQHVSMLNKQVTWDVEAAWVPLAYLLNCWHLRSSFKQSKRRLFYSLYQP